MRIDVQALGFELTPALREHTGRSMHFALGRADAHVSRLWVRTFHLYLYSRRSSTPTALAVPCYMALASSGAKPALDTRQLNVQAPS